MKRPKMEAYPVPLRKRGKGSPYAVQRNTGASKPRLPGFRKLHPGYSLTIEGQPGKSSQTGLCAFTEVSAI